MQWRQMISGYFRPVLHSPPEISLKNRNGFRGWDGKDGVIQHIEEDFIFEVKERQIVRRVLRSITEYSKRDITYKGQIATGRGRMPMIYSHQEYQILIDSAEKGYGLVAATHQINEYREEEQLPAAGLSTVCHTMN
jgi:predicted GNAT family acetyltransferase